MKITDFADEFLFDEMPKIFNPSQKVFLTHLYQAEHLVLPKKIPKIYTSARLARQFTTYFGAKGILLSHNLHFNILPPYQPIEIRMSNNKKVRVLSCEEDEEEAGINIMILLMQKNTVTHFYAGICANVRRAFFNDTFIKWIKGGVPKLFMHLGRADEYKEEVLGDDPLISRSEIAGSDADVVIADIKKIYRLENKLRARIEVPILGFERIICKLGNDAHARVAVTDILQELCSNLMNMRQFQTDIQKAKYIFNTKAQTIDEIRHCYHMYKCIYIKLSEEPLQDSDRDLNCFGYYKLHWSPLPSPTDLKFLATLLHPAEIYDSRNKSAKIPAFLFQYGKGNRRHKEPRTTEQSGEKTPVQIEKPLNSSSNGKSPLQKTCRRRRRIHYVDTKGSSSDSDTT